MDSKSQKKKVTSDGFDGDIKKAGLVPLPLGSLRRDPSEEILVKHHIKKLSMWFHTWHSWQKRVLICHVMGHCSKQQLGVLATSLEPILHLDFSSSLIPPLQQQALDTEGMTTFQIHRAITQRLTYPALVARIDSDTYVQSLPATLLSEDSNSSHVSDVTVKTANLGVPAAPEQMFLEQPPPPPTSKATKPILPALPLVHYEHTPPRTEARTSSFSYLLNLKQHQRFGSAPNLYSTAELLRESREKTKKAIKKTRAHVKSRTILAYSSSSITNKTEQFKDQLIQVANWLEKWDAVHKSYLLSELVKLCDKNMLGYFVQCLYQQLQEELNINSLPNSLLTRIMTSLEPKDLCRCAQVCKRWNACSNMARLWERHCYMLGLSEGVNNVTEMIEKVITHYRHSLSSTGQSGRPLVDWKRVYRDLCKVVARMKELVIKNAQSTLKEDEFLERIRSAAQSNPRHKLTLLEMLEILRSRCSDPNISTRELVRMAPESAAARRRRLRAERMAKKQRTLTDTSSKESTVDSVRASQMLGFMTGWSPTQNLEFAQQLMLTIREAGTTPSSAGSRVHRSEAEWYREINERNNIPVLDMALDIQPAVPHLPDPEALKCLILAGGLLGTSVPKPGQALKIPKLRRLIQMESIALCIQTDSKKLVIGNSDRTISVIDNRSGRLISLLHGHKGSVQCLQFDDYKIVSGSWDTCCIVWDVVHFTILKELNGHTDCITCLQFDEGLLLTPGCRTSSGATGSYDGSLRVWSTSTWDTVSIMNFAHTGGVTCLKLNRRVITSGGIDQCIRVWSTSTFHCIGVLPHHASLTALYLTHLLLLSCSLDGNIVLWNLDTFLPVIKRSLQTKAYITQLAQYRSKCYGCGSDGVMYELDVSTGTCTRSLIAHNAMITALSIHKDMMATVAADMTLVLWYFKKYSKVVIKGQEKVVVEEEEEQEKEEEQEEEQEDSGSELSSEVMSAREYRYRVPRYFMDFPLKATRTENFEYNFIMPS